MTKLLELNIITEKGVKYPEIPENYDGNICPYYFNRECENLLKSGMEKLGEDRVYEGCLKYCLTEFENCLILKKIRNIYVAVIFLCGFFWESQNQNKPHTLVCGKTQGFVIL